MMTEFKCLVELQVIPRTFWTWLNWIVISEYDTVFHAEMLHTKLAQLFGKLACVSMIYAHGNVLLLQGRG